MDKRLAILLLCFVVGCRPSAVSSGTQTAPLEIQATSTLTATLPSPTITLTSTLTHTPTPAPISSENLFRITPIKKIAGEGVGGGWFNNVAFSPNLNTYITNYDGQSIILWNAVTGQQINTLTTESAIFDVEFSPDGKTIAIENRNIISLWDSATGNAIRTIPCPISNSGFEFSSDSKTVFTGVAICDITTGQTLTKFDSKFHSDCFSLAISPDGKIAACTSDDRNRIGDHQIILADVSTGDFVHTLNAEEAYSPGLEYFLINSLAFSQDGKILASIDSRSKIILWDVSTGRMISSFDPMSEETGLRSDEMRYSTGLTGIETLIAFSPDGKILAAGYTFGSIIFWDVATAKPFHIIRADVPSEVLFSTDHRSAIDALVFSEDGKMLAAADGYNSATIWGLSSDMQSPPITPTPLALQGTIIVDATGSFPTTKNFSEASKADTYSISTNGGTFSILLSTEDNSNICYLVWQVRPSSDPDGPTDKFGDSNTLGTFTLDQPGDYIISIGRARNTDQCQSFSYTLKVTQP